MHKFNHDFSCILAIFAVSLFTREWIEIETAAAERKRNQSPSLRGSGLKFVLSAHRGTMVFGSPSLRGSGLKCCIGVALWLERESPSLRGSGLKSEQLLRLLGRRSVSLFTREWIEILHQLNQEKRKRRSPSLRGSGLKCKQKGLSQKELCLPLYEGVD